MIPNNAPLGCACRHARFQGMTLRFDRRIAALFAALIAAAALHSPVATVGAEPADLTPLEERPLLHEHPGRHRVAPIPPPRSVPVPPA